MVKKKKKKSYQSKNFLPSQFSWFLISHLWILVTLISSGTPNLTFLHYLLSAQYGILHLYYARLSINICNLTSYYKYKHGLWIKHIIIVALLCYIVILCNCDLTMLRRTPLSYVSFFFIQNIRHPWCVYVSSTTLVILSCISNIGPETISFFYPAELFPLHNIFSPIYIKVLILSKFKKMNCYSNSHLLSVSLLYPFSLQNFIRIYGFCSSYFLTTNRLE